MTQALYAHMYNKTIKTILKNPKSLTIDKTYYDYLVKLKSKQQCLTLSKQSYLAIVWKRLFKSKEIHPPSK
jgi:hypothetical protein